MNLGVKQKVRLGTLFFFALLLVSGGMGIYYFMALKNDTHLVLVDNYKSIRYCQEMQNILLSKTQEKDKIGPFEKQLTLQKKNITEPGEKTATETLEQDFSLLKKEPANPDRIPQLITDLAEIRNINLLAIEVKNTDAEKTAQKATTYLSLSMAFIFLVGFTFLLNFPGIISDPIQKLKTAVSEIKKKNYQHRVFFESNDEFQELGESLNSMADQLELFEKSNLKKLMVEKAKVDAVINSFQEPSLGIDKEGNVMFINHLALEILNLKNQPVSGISSESLALKNDLFRFLINDQSERPFKIVLDGKEHFFIKEKTQIQKDNEILGELITLQNITQFQERDLEKTKFIATISHELKTPISSILLGLQILDNAQTGDLNLEQKELVNGVKEEANRLLKITAELLNISQVETGKIQLAIQSCNPAEILEYAIRATRTQAEQKKITIQTSVPESLPNIKADSEKTAWVLVNLLTNAIRYSEIGKEILASISTSDKNLKFKVRDYGKGIAPEYQGKIFERYFKVPGSTGGGTGLGLAISKEFIEAQGGTIEVLSEEGNGSQFSISFDIVGFV